MARKLTIKINSFQKRNIFLTQNYAVRYSDDETDIHFKKLLATPPLNRGNISNRSYIFMDRYVLPKASDVCEDARRSISVDNAGGKSEISEMFSIDYFFQIHKIKDTILETEVDYWIDYKMVDFICTLKDSLDNPQRLGVSITRAMGYPHPENFNPHMAEKLLHKKLFGLIVARNSVIKKQSFYRSILHVWCQTSEIAELMKTAFIKLDDRDYLELKGVLLLQLTVCEDDQLYKNYIKIKNKFS